jgi:hypothetical protein
MPGTSSRGAFVPVLDARHDLAHPVEDDSAWSESYYFNGYDPTADAGLFTRIGVRPNERTVDVGLSAWLPGNRVAVVRGVRDQQVMIDGDLEVGGVCYQRVEPMRTWRLTAEARADILDLRSHASEPGQLELDLTFESLMPAIGVDGQPRAGRRDGSAAVTATTVGKGHFEQAGRWTGSIRCNGEVLTLDPARARGNRDKSWGPRRWGGPQMWRWFSINIDDSTHFGGIRLGTPAGDLHRGWVWSKGEAASIRTWDITTGLADDGVTHRTTLVRATDKLGRVHELRGRVLRVHAITNRSGDHHTLINEGLTRWAYEEHIGFGISEYLHQLDGGGRPVVPIE